MPEFVEAENRVSVTEPVFVELRRRPEAAVESIGGRLDQLVAGAQEFMAEYTPAPYDPEGHPDVSLSKTQLLSLLVGFCGADTNASLANRTHTLVYTDQDTGKSNYQTVAIPEYRSQSPFFLDLHQDGKTADLLDARTGQVITRTRVHASILGASNHYYSRVDHTLRELPTAAIVSPYSTCAGGCLGCSRAAVDSFVPPPKEYVAQHVKALADDYARRGWNRGNLISVNITTGCQPSEAKELSMMLQLIEEYRRQGFTNAKFHVFSYNIQSLAAMRSLIDAGVIGFVGTIETMNDQERIRQWGRQKGAVTFQQHLERYLAAKAAGFPIVETDYVVGTDSYDEMVRGITTLGDHGVAVVPNIKRSYTAEQLASSHRDIFDMGMRYIADGFELALATYRNGTIKRRAAEMSVEWLKAHGQADASLATLPIRHT